MSEGGRKAATLRGRGRPGRGGAVRQAGCEQGARETPAEPRQESIETRRGAQVSPGLKLARGRGDARGDNFASKFTGRHLRCTRGEARAPGTGEGPGSRPVGVGIRRCAAAGGDPPRVRPRPPCIPGSRGPAAPRLRSLVRAPTPVRPPRGEGWETWI